MKPFMKYPGGKAKEAPLVSRYKPQNINNYYEPFVGGGAIFFELDNNMSYINDYSKDLIDLYLLLQSGDKKLEDYLTYFNKLWKNIENAIIDKNLFLDTVFNYSTFKKHVEEAMIKKESTIKKFEGNGIKISKENRSQIKLTARKTAFYMCIRDIYNDKKITGPLHVASYFFLREYCYSSMFRFSKNGVFNVPYGGMSYNSKYLDGKIEYMFSHEMMLKLHKTKICNLDFERFLEEYEPQNDDFIFLDPPYDSEFSTYDQNTFDKNEQIRLKNALTKSNAKWMLIIKKTDFIYSLYSDFFIYEYNKNYMVSFKNRNEKDVKHLLITNYEIEVK